MDCKAELRVVFYFGPNGAVVFDENEEVVSSGESWTWDQIETAECDSTNGGGARHENYSIYMEIPAGSGNFVLTPISFTLICPSCKVLNPWCP